jgi:hypothetical protein
MKINKSYLEQIIKEELESILLEQPAMSVRPDDEESDDKHPTAKDFLGNPMMKNTFGEPVKWDATYDTQEEKEQHKRDMAIAGAPEDVKLWRKLSKEMAAPKASASYADDEHAESYEEAPSQSIEKPAAIKKSTTKKRRTKAQRQATLSRRIGRSVANIQNRLRKYYRDGSKTFASGEADGKYGRPGGETERVIKLFQKHKLNIAKPDGLWGKDTEKGYKKLAGKEKSWLMTPTLDKIPQKGAVQSVSAKQPSEIERLKAEFDAATKNVVDAYKGDTGKQNNPGWKRDYNTLVSRAKAAGKAYAAAKGADHDKRMAALTVKRQLAAARRKGLQNIKTASQRTRK